MMVSRGQSYYAGDALNKALVPAVKVEAVLREVKEAAAPTPPKPAPPIVREVTKVVAPEGLDKPMLKSKTLWATLTQALTGGGAAAIVSALGGLDWKVAALIIIVVAGGAYVAISERKKKANNMRELKQKVGSP